MCSWIDRDADRGADHDGLFADGVGRAQRGDDAVGDRLQGGVIGAGGGDDREFVAAEARHHVVAAQAAAQPLRDAADQLVADRVAERVVDVLEVIEIDVEDRRGRRALAYLLDRGLEPLAEEDAIGQAAERIVQGEMPQPVLAGRDGGGGAAHVAQDEAGKQREAGERDREEGNDAVDDLGARPLRRPGELRERMALLVVEIEDVVAGGGRLVELVQVRATAAARRFPPARRRR